MENRAHALAAGLFTLLLGIGLIAAVIWFRSEPIEHDSYVLHTRDGVPGLNVQAAVRLRGVDVGRVDWIRFDPQDPRVILVGISVREGTPVTRGAYAELAAQGVTGLSYVQIGDDGSDAALRRPESDMTDARIELRPSFLQRVSASGEQLVARLDRAVEQAQGWLGDGNRTQVLSMLAAIETAATRVAALSAALEPGARTLPKLAADATRTLNRTNDLLAELGKLAANADRKLETLDKVAASAERIGASAERIAVVGDRVGASVAGDTLPRMHAALEEVARTTRSLERLLDELQEHPSAVVFGRPRGTPGPGEPGHTAGASR